VSALDGLPRPAGAIAARRSVVGRILTRDLRELLQTEAKAGFVFIAELSAELRDFAERMTETGGLAVRQRIHADLLRRARGKGGDAPVILSPPPKLRDIASRVNASPETVSRELSRLRKAGLIERRANGLALLDPAALSAMLDRHRKGGL
jgi:CRP-like cAMP-binding protein